MLSSIFGGLTQIVNQLGILFGDLFDAIINLIYDSTGSGSLTPVGQLFLIGMACSLFFFVLRWVRGLIRVR